MADGGDNPYAALLSGLSNSEAAAQAENPFPDIASGISHLQIGPNMTMHGQPIAQVANPGQYALEKALQGAALGLTQGASSGLQSANNTALTNALLTGDHSGISDQLWAPMQNSMGLFGASQRAQQGVEQFKSDLELKKAAAEAVLNGNANADDPMVMKLFGGSQRQAGPAFGDPGSQEDPTGTTAMPNIPQGNPVSASPYRFPPKLAAEKGADLQKEVTTGDAATNYSDVKSHFNDLISNYPDKNPQASASMLQSFALMVSPRARFNAATGEVSTGNQGMNQTIQNWLSQVKGDGLPYAVRADVVKTGKNLLNSQYQEYLSQISPNLQLAGTHGITGVNALPGPDSLGSANTLLHNGLGNPDIQQAPKEFLTSLKTAFPELNFKKNPTTNELQLVMPDAE